MSNSISILQATSAASSPPPPPVSTSNTCIHTENECISGKKYTETQHRNGFETAAAAATHIFTHHSSSVSLSCMLFMRFFGTLVDDRRANKHQTTVSHNSRRGERATTSMGKWTKHQFDFNIELNRLCASPVSLTLRSGFVFVRCVVPM